MAVPLYIGKSSASSSVANATPDFTSSGRQSGDTLIIAAVSANEAFGSFAGWTEVSVSPKFIGATNQSGGIRLAVWTKISDGTETTVSVPDPGNHTYAVGIVVRPNAGSTLAINTLAGRVNSATTSQSGNALTTTNNDCLIVDLFGTDADSNGPSYSAEINTDLTSLIERHDAGTTLGSGSGIAIYTGEKATAGAVAATTVTGPNNNYVVITLALENIASGETLPVGLATGTSSAFSLNAKQILEVGLAIGVSTALALAPLQGNAVGLASATNTALALSAKQIAPVGLASASSTAFALATKQIVGIGLTTSSNIAYALTMGASIIASDISTALALASKNIIAVGLANDIGTSFALQSLSRLPIGLTVSSNEALTLTFKLFGFVGLAQELSTAFELQSGDYVIDPLRVLKWPYENRTIKVAFENRMIKR